MILLIKVNYSTRGPSPRDLQAVVTAPSINWSNTKDEEFWNEKLEKAII
jgi:hypothetical protein